RLQGDWSSDVCSSDLRFIHAGSYLLLDKAVDGRRIHVLFENRAIHGDIAGRRQLAVPVVPSRTLIIGKWVEVLGVATLRGQNDEPRSRSAADVDVLRSSNSGVSLTESALVKEA